ncbi:sodium:solute symporter family protein [Acetohalobium arabaticum]|uniref:Na+/solute symporter n=1 Tax=Acetohalobium arabaticum (strain ATCC 49924 / DSM 5501 / Z-7288) TaxID=574087 RepID=D9QQW5_ACEAZ|nr:sodium:solute symporter family protein [Acetohalobium arabaticum]ADL12906.1 Na+/solute symporter [Acetohalobium arabaticum DSM 5501]
MNIDWNSTLVMTAYLAITLSVASYYGGKNTDSSEDFSVGGRKFGIVILFFTMLATAVGAASVVGYTGWYYIRGLSQIWFVIGISVSYLIYLFYLAPKISDFGFEHNASTVGDWLEYRYDRITKNISSVLLIIAYLAITAFQYMAMAEIFTQVTNISYNYSLIITAAIVIIYTSIGGLWSIAATDVLQGAMTIIGLLVLTPIIISKAGGISQILAEVPDQHLQLFGHVDPVGALSFTLVFMLGIISWPDIWQRCYSAESKQSLKRSLGLFVVASIIITGGLVLFIGLGAKVLYPGYSSPEKILPFMIMKQMPNLLGSIFLAALVAVIMGTADSTLLISAVMFEKDIFSQIKPDASDATKLKVNRYATIIGGVIVLILAITAPSMFSIWVWSADITGATLAVPILLGMAWQRPSHYAALTSIITGFGGWAIARAGWIDWKPILLGSLLSLLGYLAATLLTTKETPTKQEQLN